MYVLCGGVGIKGGGEGCMQLDGVLGVYGIVGIVNGGWEGGCGL